jgi:phosphopantothenoylcysteine decarboxylase/phosphopantothenate--cysteine ligase
MRARSAASAEVTVREELFSSFADLAAALKRLLTGEHFDAVVHAAAVSDFGVEAVVSAGVVHQPGGGKLESGPEPVTLRLRALPKLVDSLRMESRNPQLTVVAFKLTTGAAPVAVSAAVDALLKRSGADFVVHNDLADRGSGGNFPASIYRRDLGASVHCKTRSDLAVALEQLLVARGQPAK